MAKIYQKSFVRGSTISGLQSWKNGVYNFISKFYDSGDMYVLKVVSVETFQYFKVALKTFLGTKKLQFKNS